MFAKWKYTSNRAHICHLFQSGKTFKSATTSTVVICMITSIQEVCSRPVIVYGASTHLSLGLRVAKEERFNNLTRSRMQKAQLAASGAEAEVCGFALVFDYSLIILQEFGFHPTSEDKPEAIRQGETCSLSSPNYECSNSSLGSERDRKHRLCWRAKTLCFSRSSFEKVSPS